MISRTQEEIMHKWPVEYSGSLVSIRCLTYNHEQYIADALDGFLKQETNFPFEVIVHDDASTDETANIIREYEKKYPKIIKPIYEKENQYSKHDGSLSRIMEAACNGKYHAFCEGDDCWIAPNKLQMQVDWLEDHPEYTMCFHCSEINNEYNIPCNLNCKLVKDKDYSATELFQEWIVPTASICIRKDVLSYPIKHSENILNGDIILIEKAAHSGKVRGSTLKMAVYRVHPAGVTYDPKFRMKRILAYPNHFLAIKENFPLIKRRVINKIICDSYIQVWTCADHQNRWLRMAFFSSPMHFVKVFVFGGFANAYCFAKKKKYKDAFFSLPILRFVVPFVYYNILRFGK